LSASDKANSRHARMAFRRVCSSLCCLYSACVSSCARVVAAANRRRRDPTLARKTPKVVARALTTKQRNRRRCARSSVRRTNMVTLVRALRFTLHVSLLRMALMVSSPHPTSNSPFTRRRPSSQAITLSNCSITVSLTWLSNSSKCINSSR